MPDKQPTVMVEDAKIIFRNFTGKEGPYNRKGQRNFCVILDEDVVEDLVRDGWNVKYTNPREEGDVPTPYLPVEVSYNNYPPKITTITSTGRTILDEDMVEMLDFADIEKIDLIVNAYDWTVRDESGRKAYLKTMFVTINEDELEKKYAVKKAGGG